MLRRPAFPHRLVFALVGMLVAFSCALLLAGKEAQARAGSPVPDPVEKLPAGRDVPGKVAGPLDRETEKTAGHASPEPGAGGSSPVDARSVREPVRESGEKITPAVLRKGTEAPGRPERTIERATDPIKEIEEAARPALEFEPTVGSVREKLGSVSRPAFEATTGAVEPVIEKVGVPEAGATAGPVLEELPGAGPILGRAAPVVEPDPGQTTSLVGSISEMAASAAEPYVGGSAPSGGPAPGAAAPVTGASAAEVVPDRASRVPPEFPAPVTGASAAEAVPPTTGPASEPALPVVGPFSEPVAKGVETVAETVPSPREERNGIRGDGVSPAPTPPASTRPALPAPASNTPSVSAIVLPPPPVLPSISYPNSSLRMPGSPSSPGLKPAPSPPSGGAVGAAEGVEAALPYYPLHRSTVEKDLGSTAVGAPAFYARPFGPGLAGERRAVSGGAGAAVGNPHHAPPRPSPFGLPFGLPSGFSTGGSVGGAGSGDGPLLLGVLALLPVLARLGALSRSPREVFRLVSFYKPVTELPG